MKHLTLIAVAAGLLASSPALAQTVFLSPTPEPPPRDLGGAFRAYSPSAYTADMRGRAPLNSDTRRALNNASPARLNRAERIAELINAHDCAGAHDLAMRENDRRLAHRVAEVCQTRN